MVPFSEGDLMNLSKLTTEQQKPASAASDTRPARDIVAVISENDRGVADAVASRLDEIAAIASAAAHSIENGGRLIYMGAGTSGRLGVIDAAECRPTYGVPDGVVIGLIAGGMEAMFHAVEGAEDSLTLGADDLRALNVSEKDTVVGIASSGRTPYVIGGLNYAREAGCTTAAVSCVPDAAISSLADIAVEAVTGPEVVTGSTRMKAGTAQKMILNMISTTAFILCGKTYGNLMVDVCPTNEKLVARAVRIITTAAECDENTARTLLEAGGMNVKTALVMAMTGCSADDARTLLARHRGHIRDAVKNG